MDEKQMISMVKYYSSVIWFVVVLTAATTVGGSKTNLETESKHPIPFTKWSVSVVNELSGVQTLWVHCQSADDNLAEQTLKVGETYMWKFRVNFWATTLFWCDLRSYPVERRVSFQAFWRERQHWLGYRCEDVTCVWIAQDDGIYLRNIPDKTLELIHPWQ